MNLPHHKLLAEGGWYTLSLAEQLGNIGSEVYRALKAKGNQTRYENAFIRGLELFDLTINDTRWRTRLKEITRARELFCDAILGGHEYGTTLEDLNKYFTSFAIAARKN